METLVRNKTQIILLVIIFLTAGLGFFVTWRVYHTVSQDSKQSLIHRAETVAATVSPEYVKSIPAEPKTVSTPEYANLKDILFKIIAANSDTRFVYLIKDVNGEIRFLADSEKSTSPDYSPPGQIYYEASPEFKQLFVNAKPLIEGPLADRWGTWLTASAPIIDPNTHEVVAAVGMDTQAHDYYVQVWSVTALPAALSLLFLILLIVIFIFQREQQRFLELKYQFVSIASHELRSPLNGILWASQSILGDSHQPIAPHQQEILQNVEYTTARLLETVNDILNLSAMEKGSHVLALGSHNLVGLCVGLIKDSTLAAKEHGVEVVMSSNWPVEILVTYDQDKLRRAVSNILSNAIKYSRPHTQITFGYAGSADPSYVTFFVKDQGIGIPAGSLKTIFKGYYRADNAVATTAHGTGLGLFFAKKIIEMHNGTIWCESQEGKGATFYISLPKTHSI